MATETDKKEGESDDAQVEETGAEGADASSASASTEERGDSEGTEGGTKRADGGRTIATLSDADTGIDALSTAPSQVQTLVQPVPDDGREVVAPVQLGTRRFVYAAYFAGAIGIAFLGSKLANLLWQRLQSYKPEVGDPQDNLIMPIAALVGAAVAYYYWRKASARQYAEEVASELAQVTWPTRQEVTNSTTVVIIATAFATIFFALMDRFWAFVTDLVYRF